MMLFVIAVLLFVAFGVCGHFADQWDKERGVGRYAPKPKESDIVYLDGYGYLVYVDGYGYLPVGHPGNALPPPVFLQWAQHPINGQNFPQYNPFGN